MVIYYLSKPKAILNNKLKSTSNSIFKESLSGSVKYRNDELIIISLEK